MKKHLKRRTFILTCLIAVLTLGLIAPAGISLPGIQAENVYAASSYRTTNAAVNMRESYDTKSDVLTVIPANTRVEYLNNTQLGWLHVRYNGKIGWVYEEYFYGNSSDTPSYTPSSTVTPTAGYNIIGVYTVAESLNLRSSMSTASSANIIGLVPKGAQVGVIRNYNNQWYEILYNGKTRGYIVGGHFTTDTSRMNNRSSSTQTYGKTVKKVTRRWVKIRSAMNLKSTSVIRKLPKGTVLYVLDRKPNNWYQVRWNDITCYVLGGYFTNNNYKEVTASRLNLRSSKSTSRDSNIILTIPEGKKVTVKKAYRNSRWLRVKYNGVTGYVKDGYFE